MKCSITQQLFDGCIHPAWRNDDRLQWFLIGNICDAIRCKQCFDAGPFHLLPRLHEMQYFTHINNKIMVEAAEKKCATDEEFIKIYIQIKCMNFKVARVRIAYYIIIPVHTKYKIHPMKKPKTFCTWWYIHSNWVANNLFEIPIEWAMMSFWVLQSMPHNHTTPHYVSFSFPFYFILIVSCLATNYVHYLFTLTKKKNRHRTIQKCDPLLLCDRLLTFVCRRNFMTI